MHIVTNARLNLVINHPHWNMTTKDWVLTTMSNRDMMKNNGALTEDYDDEAKGQGCSIMCGSTDYFS